MKKILAFSLLALAMALSFAPSALAQNFNCEGGFDKITKLPCVSAGTSPVNPTGFFGTVQTVFNIVFGILVIVASFMLLYAAFEYITAKGDEEKLGNAKNMIVYAIVAVVVAIFAWGLPRVVIGFFGGQ